MVRILSIAILLLCEVILIDGLKPQSKPKIDRIMQDICEQVDEHDSDSDENRKWYDICENWLKERVQQQLGLEDEDPMDELYKTHILQPRRAHSSRRGRTSARYTYGGFRISRSRSHSLPPIGKHYHNTRLNKPIHRPHGWQWSRSRSRFLPLSTIFFHRTYSLSNRFTSSAKNLTTYYYCTSNSTNKSTEIQCSSIHGDTQCCEDEKTKEAFCCGGKISDDLIEDPNRAAQIVERIFYTLATVTLCLHIVKRYLN